MEFIEEMEKEVKDVVVELLSRQMARGWSLDQVEAIFIVGARKALDELVNMHGRFNA